MANSNKDHMTITQVKVVENVMWIHKKDGKTLKDLRRKNQAKHFITEIHALKDTMVKDM